MIPGAAICSPGANRAPIPDASTSPQHRDGQRRTSLRGRPRESPRADLRRTGQYLGQWNNLHRPCGLFADRRDGGTFFVGELPTHLVVNQDVPNLGARVSILSIKGELLGRVGGRFAGEQRGSSSRHTDARSTPAVISMSPKSPGRLADGWRRRPGRFDPCRSSNAAETGRTLPAAKRVAQDGLEFGGPDASWRAGEQTGLLERSSDEGGNVALGVADRLQAIGNADVAHERSQRLR